MIHTFPYPFDLIVIIIIIIISIYYYYDDGFLISWDVSIFGGGCFEEMLKEQFHCHPITITRAPPNVEAFSFSGFSPLQRLRVINGNLEWEELLRPWHQNL